MARTFSGRRGLDSGATTRDIWYDVYMDFAYDPLDMWGHVSHVELTVGMSVTQGQQSCKHATTFGGATQRNHITKTVKEWTEFYDPPQSEPKPRPGAGRLPVSERIEKEAGRLRMACRTRR